MQIWGRGGGVETSPASSLCAKKCSWIFSLYRLTEQIFGAGYGRQSPFPPIGAVEIRTVTKGIPHCLPSVCGIEFVSLVKFLMRLIWIIEDFSTGSFSCGTTAQKKVGSH